MKTRKIASLVLALLMVLSTNVISASATDAVISTDSNVICTISGATVSVEFAESIEDLGAKINDDTVIQVISVNSRTNAQDGQALLITNIDGNSATKDIFLFAGDDVVIAPGSRYTYYPPKDMNAGFMVHATARYEVYMNGLADPYYRPMSVEFYYEKTQDCNVTYISTIYRTVGYQYTYPGFEPVNNNNLIEYSIPLRESSPTVNKLYQKVDNYYSGDVVIRIANNPLAQASIDFYCMADGITYSYGVNLGL